MGDRTSCKYSKHGCSATFGAGDAAGEADHEATAWRSHMSLLELKVKNLALSRKQTALALQGARERCLAAEIEETKSRAENERLREVVRQLQAQVQAQQQQAAAQQHGSSATTTTITTTTTSSHAHPALTTAGATAATDGKAAPAVAASASTVHAHAHAKSHARAHAQAHSPSRRPFDEAVLGVAAKSVHHFNESPTLRGTAGHVAPAVDPAQALPESAKPKVTAGPYGLGAAAATGSGASAGAGAGTSAGAFTLFARSPVDAGPATAQRALQQVTIRKLTSSIERLQTSLQSKQHELEKLKASVATAWPRPGQAALNTTTAAVAHAPGSAAARSGSPSGSGFWAPLQNARINRRRAAYGHPHHPLAVSAPALSAVAAAPAAARPAEPSPASSLSKQQRVRGASKAATTAAVAMAHASLNPTAFAGAGADLSDAEALGLAMAAARADPHPVLQRWEHGDTVMYVYKDANAVGSYSGPGGAFVQGVDELKARGFVLCAKADEPRVVQHMSATTDWDNERDVAAAFAAVQNDNIGLSSYALDESIQQQREERVRNQPKPLVQRLLCGNEWLKLFKAAPQRQAQAAQPPAAQRPVSAAAADDDD